MDKLKKKFSHSINRNQWTIRAQRLGHSCICKYSVAIFPSVILFNCCCCWWCCYLSCIRYHFSVYWINNIHSIQKRSSMQLTSVRYIPTISTILIELWILVRNLFFTEPDENSTENSRNFAVLINVNHIKVDWTYIQLEQFGIENVQRNALLSQGRRVSERKRDRQREGFKECHSCKHPKTKIIEYKSRSKGSMENLSFTANKGKDIEKNARVK